MASGFEISRRNVTNLRVEVQGSRNQLTVDVVLWFAVTPDGGERS